MAIFALMCACTNVNEAREVHTHEKTFGVFFFFTVSGEANLNSDILLSLSPQKLTFEG